MLAPGKCLTWQYAWISNTEELHIWNSFVRFTCAPVKEWVIYSHLKDHPQFSIGTYFRLHGYFHHIVNFSLPSFMCVPINNVYKFFYNNWANDRTSYHTKCPQHWSLLSEYFDVCRRLDLSQKWKYEYLSGNSSRSNGSSMVKIWLVPYLTKTWAKNR